jgi:hypothetical protein
VFLQTRLDRQHHEGLAAEATDTLRLVMEKGTVLQAHMIRPLQCVYDVIIPRIFMLSEWDEVRTDSRGL